MPRFAVRPALCAIAGFLSTLVLASTLSAAPPKDKLNVLFFAVDDLRPELNCYGQSHIKSPNLDRLAATGVLFDNAYCQQAVCSPSRTSLLTGLRPDSTKVYDLQTHFRDTTEGVITLPQLFKQNGYLSIGMGKIYHGSLNDAASWSIPHWRPWGKVEGVSGYNIPENQAYIARRRAEGREKGLKGRALSRYAYGPPTEGADVADSRYPDGAIADHAVATLRDLAEGNQPFFLAVGFMKPHLPFNSPKRYWDLYDRDAIEVSSVTDWPLDAPSFAGSGWGELRHYQGMPESGSVTEEQAKELIHGYYASVSFTDANVGKVIDELERQGLRDNTVIVLWGDHGWKLSEYGAWCKHTNFELDTRAPLLVSMPGAEGNGRVSGALVEFVDIYPTLAHLAGLDAPRRLEGTSFAPLLDDPNRPWKQAVFSQYPRGFRGGPLMGYSMRTADYRFTRWVERNSPETIVALELYDHRQGRTATENVADRAENEELVRQLLEQSKAGWRGVREELDPSGR